jgi:predicted nucleic acid-binding Zn ribbon protein
MPLYVYRIVPPTTRKRGGRAGGDDTFEVRQSIHDPPLTTHPETKEPVERVLTAPNIASGRLGDAQIANSGLTKYKRTSDGTYERQAGAGGPKHLNPRG